MESPTQSLAPSDEPLFDPSVLKWVPSQANGVQADHNGALRLTAATHIVLRPLRRGDIRRGYISLLAQLTKAPDVSEVAFSQRFDELRSHGDYFILVRRAASCVGGGEAELAHTPRPLHTAFPRLPRIQRADKWSVPPRC